MCVRREASRPRAVPRHVGLASPMCVLCVHEHRARAGPPHTAASVAVGIAAHCLQARRVGPGTTRRATIVYVSPHCMHAQLTVPRATCAGHAPLCCTMHRVVATFEPELRAHHRLRRRAERQSRTGVIVLRSRVSVRLAARSRVNSGHVTALVRAQNGRSFRHYDNDSGARQRGTFETLSLRAAWGPFVLFEVVRKGSPLHTAIDALQPEPQSGPGSSIDDQMLGY